MEKKATGDSKLNDSPVYYLLEYMDFYKNNYLWLHCMNIEEQQTVKKLCEELLSGLKMSKKTSKFYNICPVADFREISGMIGYSFVFVCLCIYLSILYKKYVRINVYICLWAVKS